MAGLSLKSVKKRFGETEVIGGVDLDVKDGEFVVFVGPSGCGKSTLLRMIAGLETTTGGRIEIGGRDVTSEDPARRGIAISALRRFGKEQDPLAAWIEADSERIARTREKLLMLTESGETSVSRLSVASGLVADLTVGA